MAKGVSGVDGEVEESDFKVSEWDNRKWRDRVWTRRIISLKKFGFDEEKQVGGMAVRRKDSLFLMIGEA